MRFPNSTDFVSAVPIHLCLFSRDAMSRITCDPSPAFALGVRAEIPNKYEEVVTMRISTITKSRVVILTAVLFAALPIGLTLPVQAADLLVQRPTGFAPMAELDVMASGAAEDTLKACIARIPVFASAGQRMLAEQSCAGAEEVRKTLRSVTKF